MPDDGLIVDVPVATLLNLLPEHPYELPPWDKCPPFTVADVLACNGPDPGQRDWAAADLPIG